jgi:hypothetical protein
MTRGPEKRKPQNRSGRPWEPALRAHAEAPKQGKKHHGKCHGDEHDAASAVIGQTVCHKPFSHFIYLFRKGTYKNL